MTGVSVDGAGDGPVASVSTIKVQSSEGETFNVARNGLGVMSGTIHNLLEDLAVGESDSPEECIPLPNVDSSILKKVIEWCEKHKDDPPSTAEVDPDKTTVDICEWDAEFLKDLDRATLFHVILAANYLNISGLLDVGCQTVANMLKGKTTEEMRTLLNVQNDFSPEEMEQIRKENAWCED